MKNRFYLQLTLGMFLILSAFFAGCIGDSDSGDEELDIYENGTTWVFNINDESLGTGTMTLMVKSSSYLYNGIDTAVVSLEYKLTPKTEAGDEMIYDDMIGTGEVYIRKSDNQAVHQEFEMIMKSKENIADEWDEIKFVHSEDVTITGFFPEELEEGMTFSLTETSTYNDETYLNGELMMEDSDTETSTTNYEVKAKKTVTVPAGTFEAFEIRGDTTGETSYELVYFCPEIDFHVKEVEYENNDMISMMELKSYSYA